MAIFLKKKPALAPVPAPVVQSTAPLELPPQAMSPREEEALAEVGLLPDPAPKKVGLVIKKKPKVGRFREGDKVRITNELYSWVTRWKPGDTGVVTKYSGPVQEMKGDLNYGVLIVRLDNPREKQHSEVYLHAWEVEPLEAQQ